MNLSDSLEMLFQQMTICPLGIEIPITLQQVNEICGLVQQHQRNSSALVNINFKSDVDDTTAAMVHVVGDVHGQFSDVLQFFRRLGFPSRCNKYVFLGDYVDRGMQSLELILFLFLNMLKFGSSNVVLLRGNHEDKDWAASSYSLAKQLGKEDQCKNYTCCLDIDDRYPNDIATSIIKIIYDTFDFLVLTAVIENQILCLHGCIPSFAQNLDFVKSIQLPFGGFLKKPQSLTQYLIYSMLWSDPLSDEILGRCQRKTMIFGQDSYQIAENVFRNNTGELVNISTINSFLNNNNFKFLFRGHESTSVGIRPEIGGKVFTIFSATDYLKMMNKQDACVLSLTQNEDQIAILVNLFKTN